MPVIRKRLHNALTGKELKEMILKEVSAHMDLDSYFRGHLTYPNVHFKWQLVVRSYPNEPPEFKNELEQAARVDDWQRDPLQMVKEGTLESEHEIDAPDKAREANQDGTAIVPEEAAAYEHEGDADSPQQEFGGGRMVRVKGASGAGENFPFEKHGF
jgi:hypothetical protein